MAKKGFLRPATACESVSAARTLQSLPVRSLAASLSAVLGLSWASQAVAAVPPPPTSSNIAADGRTQTTVNPTASSGGTNYNISTKSFNGNKTVAFNSFGDFQLAQSDSATFVVPVDTASKRSMSLVNLVWNSQAYINGSVNSVLSTGGNGGAVFFADPHGVVVGANAVINVGALSLSAPSQNFMNSLLDKSNNLQFDSTAFTTLLQGQEELAKSSDGGCLVCIVNGAKITAGNAVRIRATAIDASGTIAVLGNGGDTLSTAVNVEGGSTPTVVTDGNTIRLIAQDSDSASIGDASAASSITIGSNALLQTSAGATKPLATDATFASWGLIQASATADTKAAYSTPTTSVLTKQAGDLLKDQQDFFAHGIDSAVQDANLAASDKLGQIAYVRASSSASVNVAGTIQAAGDVMLGASTRTEASTAATSRAGSSAAPVMVGAMYGAVFSKANTSIGSGATVTAGGALAVSSDTDNELEVAASTVAGSQVLASTVAWSQAAVSASSVVNSGATLSSGELSVTAHNSNSFATEAETQTGESKGSIGVAGAISLQTVQANAQLNASPSITDGNVSVLAATDTSKNSTVAKTGTEAPDTSKSTDQTASTNADLSGTLANKSNAGLNGGGAGADSTDALPFHLGAAVAYTGSQSTSDAAIGDGVHIDTAGDVAVYSAVNDAGIHNGAVSNAVSKAAEGGTSAGTSGGTGSAGSDIADVAAAVAYANYQHQSSATIGRNAVISAAHIGVGSDVTVPFDWYFGQSGNLSTLQSMGGSLDDFVDGAKALQGLASLGAKSITDAASGYASASSGGNADVAVGGSVNYFGMTNSNRAWVGDGAQLTSTAPTGSAGWSTTLDWSTTPLAWAHAIAVEASTDVQAFNLVGDITPWKPDANGSNAAIGGAFNYAGYNNGTVAGVGSGAVLDSSNDVAVNATSTDKLVALSPTSGKGGTAGLQGTVAITDVNDSTHASVSAGATVNANALSVVADNPLMVWSLSGAVAMSNGASVGLSVGVNQLSTDTQALIGDNSGDDTGGTPGAQSGGVFTVSALTLQGHTSGESGALSVAGTSVTSSSQGGSGSSGGESSTPPGSDLLKMIGKVASVTGKLKKGLEKVDSTGGDDSSDLLGKASDVLGSISSAGKGVQGAGQGLSKLVGKASSLGESKGGGSTSGTTGSSQFGIGISGAASVNMASLNSSAQLSGVTVQQPGGQSNVTIQSLNEASLVSMAGAAALQRSQSSSFSGALAGAVAYSDVADTTTASIDGSTLTQAGQVAVRALDASQQVDVAVGMGVNTSSSTSATLAGSVSVAQSSNTTSASIDGGSVLDGGTASDGSVPAGNSLEVSAYDRSRIGVGGGSLYFNSGSGSSANIGLGFTYASIADTTNAALSGHTGSAADYDINHYNTLTVQALDAAQIGSGALAGGYSGSQNSTNLAGAAVWNQIGNTTAATINGGMNINVAGDATVQAGAVAPVSALEALISAPASEGYDFTGASMGSPSSAPTGGSAAGSSGDPAQPDATALDFSNSGIGSSIIAVAGTVQVGGNNVGLSYAGNQVDNTHVVAVESASLSVGGKLSLQAQDQTRIISLAVGGAMSTGQFAGLGSATSNSIGNRDLVLIGSAVDTGVGGQTPGGAVSLTAGSIDAGARDQSSIYSLAGNVAVGQGSVAAGGAVTYNDIANEVTTHVGNTSVNTGSGALNVTAAEDALIMAGAVAGAVNASGGGTALTLSFGWNQTGNAASAIVDDGSTVRAGSLGIGARNASSIYALAGGVSIGGTAAVGLAGVVADNNDTTTATLQNAGLSTSGAATVGASGSGVQYSLAVSGAGGTQGAGVAASATYNTIGSDVTAQASNLYGLNAQGGLDATLAAKAASLAVTASNSAGIYSLAGGIGIGSEAGVGAAASVANVGGSTSASLSDSVLDVSGSTTVSADSGTTIDTASIAGAVAGGAAVSASDTTNLISNRINASMSNVGTAGTSDAAVSSSNITTVSASNRATINALSGAIGGAGSVAVGAATSVNRIGTDTEASFNGGAGGYTYKAKQLLVSAGAGNPGGNASDIRTIAVGAAGGGDVAAAGSVAVNLLSSTTSASIGQGAKVIASGDVGVLAGNHQGIDVLAGQAALSGAVGVGVGVVVNDISGSTSAGIYDSAVTAYGNGNGLQVDSGVATNGATLDGSVNITGSSSSPSLVADPAHYAAPDLSGTSTVVHGVAVNASNAQNIATLGIGASVAGAVAVNGLAGVNIVGGSTTATIQNASINQADRDDGTAGSGGQTSGDGTTYKYAQGVQQADVRASSRQYEANFVANVAGSGAVAADASVATNVFNANTTAQTLNSTLSSQGATTVAATGDQWSLAVAAGVAASGVAGGAASGTVSIFNTATTAGMSGGNANAGSLAVRADSAIASAQIAGSAGVGIGGAGLAGAAAVNVDQAQTSASIDAVQVNTSGATDVSASSRNTSEAVAAAAGASGGAGIAGAAIVNVIGNGTHASINDSTVNASDIGVHALDAQYLGSITGAAGGGSGGLGGGITLDLLQASVGTQVAGSTLTAFGGTNSGGDIAVDALSSRQVSSVTASAGVGAVGVGLSAGVIVAGTGDITDSGQADAGGDLNAHGQMNLGNLDSLGSQQRLGGDPSSYGLSSTEMSQVNQSSSYQLSGATGSGSSHFGEADGVQARLVGSTLAAKGDVSVDAQVKNATSNTAGGVAGGLVAVGGALAYTTLNSDIQAAVDGGSTVNAGGNVHVGAAAADNGNHAVSTNAIAGTGGLVGVGAAVAVSHVANQVSAIDSGTLAGQGTLTLSASDSSSVLAGNANAQAPNGVNIGGIVAGVVVVDALRDSTVNASIAAQTQTSGFNSVALTATDSGQVLANGVMGSGGLLAAGNAVVSNASDSSDVTAQIGSGASVTAGSTSLTASAAPQAEANAYGISVAGAYGIGATVATAGVTANARARVDDQASFGNGNLSVYAAASPEVSANATGGAGALLLGLNASVAEASDSAGVLASVGDNVTLPSGNVSIDAASHTHQSAYAAGVAAGLVSVGASSATASSNTTTTASLGNGNGNAAATTGSLSVVAQGDDTNDASSKAGSGGLVSGNASLATTRAASTTNATVGSNLALAALQSFQLSAQHTSAYGGTADSVLAAALGGSGASVNNSIASSTQAAIGDNTQIETQGNFDVLAQSILGNDSANNGGASGGAGSIASGIAAQVQTNVSTDNSISVGQNDTLVSGKDASMATRGHIAMIADTLITALGDSATISTGGAVPVGNAGVDITGNFNSHLGIGDGSELTSYGRTDIATYAAIQQMAAVASTNSYGAAAVGAAESTVNLISNQSLNVGNNVNIVSYDEADIVAGRDVMNAQQTVLNPAAIAQSYVRGLIAIPDASATANTTSNAVMTLGRGSTVTGGGDVGIGSLQGTTNITVDGTGHGYELGLIPVTHSDNNQSSVGSASTTLDGSVTAGAYNTIKFTIDANGNWSSAGSTAPVPFAKLLDFNPTAYLQSLMNNPGGSYQGMDNANVGGFVFGQLLVSGGNAYLYGSAIGGSGKVVANGAPSVDIENASPYYLVLPSIEANFGSSGQVFVSGGADANHLGNLSVSQAPSDAVPTITINSSYPAHTPANSPLTPGIILGDVVNLGGAVNVTDLAGSLFQTGSVSANSQNVYIPNGYVVVQPNSGGNWFSGGDPTSNIGSGWISNFLNGVIQGPGYAAAAIAEAYYGSSVSSSPYIGNVPSGDQAQVLVLYGSCAPYTGGSGSESALDGCGSASGGDPSVGTWSVLGRPVPMIPSIALSQSGKFSGSELSSTSAFTGQSFIVKAQYIDIDGAINAGTAATWTVQTTPALASWITAQKQAYQSGSSTQALIGIPQQDSAGNTLLKVVDSYGNSRLIGASYNVQTGQIVLDPVNASGGGTVYLEGKIVSTAKGSINVNSGYGSVDVENTTGAALVVQSIYAGSGGLGQITIVDKAKTWKNGVLVQNSGNDAAATTWYVSQNGEQAQIFDNRNGAADWTESLAFNSGNVATGAAYQPLAGTEYAWTAQTQVQRSWNTGSGNHSWGTGAWSWASGSGGTNGNQWSITSSGFIDPGASGHVDLNGNDYQLQLSGAFTAVHGVTVAYHGCDDGDCHYGTKESGTDSSGNPASLWRYLYPTQGYLNLTDTQRADLPIAINFVTSSTNNVKINSNSDILLSGWITNTRGHTEINSTGGDIVQASNNATIWTHDLEMSSTTGKIGSDSAPIQVRIAHDSQPGSTLTASTRGGDIDINVDSGNHAQELSAIAVGTDAAGQATYGNVTINGTGSLVGIVGNALDVAGRDINLTSSNGSVGSLATPLNIQAHGDLLYNGALNGGVVTVHAYGDVGLKDSGGDLWVGNVTSTTGDVSLEAVDGGIYDARQLTAASTLSPSQAKAVWDRLHLTDGTAGQATVTAVESQVNSNYAQYWQLLQVGSVNNGSYTVDPKNVALYWPLAAAAAGIDPSSVADPAQQAAAVQAYLSHRYDDMVASFVTYLGSDWQTQSEFAGLSQAKAGWSFTLDPNSSQYQTLTRNAGWTTSQLMYAINAVALAAPTGGQVGVAAPNVQGNNIALKADVGGVGRNDKPVTISYQSLLDLYNTGNSSLTQEQILALGLANAPGDVQLLDGSGNVISPTDANLANLLKTISIAQTMPLYLQATGAVTGSAQGSAYLQANGDLDLGGFSSGTDMRLAATGSIQSASGANSNLPVLTSGGDLVLTAGSGHISAGNGTGTQPGDPLRVQIGGRLLGASAQTDLLLQQMNGDLTVGTVFANGLASLSAPQGSILAMLGSLSIDGRSVTLDASGDVGRRVNVATGVDAPIELQVGTGGELNVTAGGEVNVDSPQFALTIGKVQGGGNVVVTAQQAGVDAQSIVSTGGNVIAAAAGDGHFDDVQAQGNAALNAAASLQAGNVTSNQGDIALNAASGMELGNVTANAGSITALLTGNGQPLFQLDDRARMSAAQTLLVDASGALQMGQGSAMRAGGALSLASTGDMQLGLVQSDATQANALDIRSGGAIRGNGDSLNLKARNGGNTLLQALNDIGSAALPIVVDVNSLSGSSATGSVWLRALNGIDVTAFSTPGGSFDLAADGALRYGQLAVGGNATLAGASIDGDTLAAGGTASLVSTAGTTLNSVQAGGELKVLAGSTLQANSLRSGGNAALQSGSDMTLGSVSAGADLNAVAGGALGAATLIAQQGSMNLQSGSGMQVGHAVAARDLTGHAGAALQANDLQAGGSTLLSAGDDADVDVVESGGTFVLTAGGHATLQQVQAGTGGSLDAQGALALRTLLSGGSVALHSGDNMQLADATLTAGSLTASAGGDFTLSDRIDVPQGNAQLSSGGTMTLASVQAGQNLSATAGAALQASTLQAGGSGALQSAGSMTLGTVTTGGNLDMQSGQQMGFATLKAGGHVFGQTQQGGIQGDGVQAGDWIRFVAPGNVHIGSLAAGSDIGLQAGGEVTTQTMAAGHDVAVHSGDNANLYSTTAGNALVVDSGAAIVMHDGSAGHSIDLAAQQLGFSWLTAPDSIRLLARAGSILGATLTTRDAFVAANGDIQLDAAYIGDRVELQANNISAYVKQTTNGQPLYSLFTGYRGAVARSIVVDADAPQDWMIDRLSAVNAALSTTASRVDMASAHIEETMSLRTPLAYAWMNQHSAILVPATVQMMQPAYDFQFFQNGMLTLTDAFVIRYSFGDGVTTPNYLAEHTWLAPDYFGESALRFNGRMLSERTEDRGEDQVNQHALPAWSRTDASQLVRPADDQAASVNINAPE